MDNTRFIIEILMVVFVGVLLRATFSLTFGQLLALFSVVILNANITNAIITKERQNVHYQLDED